MSELQQDDSGLRDAGADVDVDVDLPIPSWEVRLKELADHREKHALQCSSTLQQNNSNLEFGSDKAGIQVAPEGKTSPMTFESKHCWFRMTAYAPGMSV
jgi:hypothetical protein